MDDIERSRLASWLKRNMANPRVAIYVDAAERRIMDLKEDGPEPREPRVDRRTYMRNYMKKYRKKKPNDGK